MFRAVTLILAASQLGNYALIWLVPINSKYVMHVYGNAHDVANFNAAHPTHRCPIQRLVAPASQGLHFLTHSLTKEQRKFLNMLYICNNYEQLNAIILPVTQDYLESVSIHVCTLTHRDELCSNSAELLHDGLYPHVSMIYIPFELQRGAEILISQLKQNITEEVHNNEDDAFIFTCPGCGTPFSQQ